MRDRVTGAIARVSANSAGEGGNNSSWDPAITADGRYVAFSSSATNLVPLDTNDYGDVFLHDRTSGQTTRISVSGEGVQAERKAAVVLLSARTVATSLSAQTRPTWCRTTLME